MVLSFHRERPSRAILQAYNFSLCFLISFIRRGERISIRVERRKKIELDLKRKVEKERRKKGRKEREKWVAQGHSRSSTNCSKYFIVLDFGENAKKDRKVPFSFFSRYRNLVNRYVGSKMRDDDVVIEIVLLIVCFFWLIGLRLRGFRVLSDSLQSPLFTSVEKFDYYVAHRADHQDSQ